MPSDAANWIGRRLLERYEIVRELGRGGMAVAYQARDHRLHGDVVIKVPQAALLQDSEFGRRFARETGAMVSLAHPHIVRIIDAGEHGGLPFVVLQYLSGGSLRTRYLAGGKLSALAGLGTWLPQVASALDYIHQQQFVHRDVKPDNILFDAGGNAYLSDFGVAKVLANSPRTKMTVVTAAGTAIGTPRYMAPEMLLGIPFDGRADQFALAATVYEVLSGRMPFDGKTLMTVFEQQKQPPVRLDKLAPQVLSEVASAVQKALDRVPAQRFASCKAFAGAVLNADMGIVVPDEAPAPTKSDILAAPTIMPVRVPVATPVPAPAGGFGRGADKPAKGLGLVVTVAVLGIFLAVTVTGLAAMAYLIIKHVGSGQSDQNLAQQDQKEKQVSSPTGWELKPKVEPKQKSDSKLDPESKPYLQPKLDPEPKTEPKPKTDPAHPAPKTVAKKGPEIKIDPKSKPVVEPKTAQDEDPLIRSMKFVRVPKATFWMGGGGSRPPNKQVEIEQDFEIAAYTVTQEQWQEVMGNNPSWFSRQGNGADKVESISDADLKRFPVEYVSWKEVQDFLKKLNERAHGRGWYYRLPSEAQWEYACRGGATSMEECSYNFYLDKPTNVLSSVHANFNGDFPAGQAEKGPNLGRPQKVGSYPPNKLGLYDMHGNVWQWCNTLWDSTTSLRVVCGGGFGHGGQFCVAACRGRVPPSWRKMDLGFRLARAPADGVKT